MPYLVEELEGETVQTSYTPDLTVSVEAGLVSLAVRQWQIRR
jgi:hypothetical protein